MMEDYTFLHHRIFSDFSPYWKCQQTHCMLIGFEKSTLNIATLKTVSEDKQDLCPIQRFVCTFGVERTVNGISYLDMLAVPSRLTGLHQYWDHDIRVFLNEFLPHPWISCRGFSYTFCHRDHPMWLFITKLC